APTEVASGLQRPGGLFARDGRLYWLEVTGGVEPGLAFLPAAGPIASLRCREPSGQVRTVGACPAGAIFQVPEESGAGPGDIVGVAEGAVIARLRRVASTELVRFPIPSGSPARLATEPGVQFSALAGSELYWTAPSEEAMPETVLRCVRHAS